VTRQRSRELNLSEHELVVTRDALDSLKDRIYVLACAVEDVEYDLRPDADPTARDCAAALDWILEAARPLVRGEVIAVQTGTSPNDSSRSR